MNYKNLLLKFFVPLALIIIFLFSYYIRSVNIVPDRLLSFDPIFQYRYTYYLANYGHLPVWDEITYYVGRLFEINTSPPLMLYVTATIYLLVKNLGLSLMTVASYMSAIYGALIVVPAFLLGRELSNKYGGLISALLIGTAPQILVRTFGSSYDTDQLVIFFLLLTLYLGFYALKKRTIPAYCLTLMGFSGFLLTWGYSFYSFFILFGFVIIYFILNSILRKDEPNKLKFSERVKKSFIETKQQSVFLVFLLIGLTIFAFINRENIILHITNVIGFAGQAETWIVNISIAELQLFEILSISGWINAMGNFITTDLIVTVLIFTAFIFMIGLGFFMNYKKRNIRNLAILSTLFLIGIYTTSRGVRFVEFTSTFFILLIATGFGNLLEWSKKDVILRSATIGLVLFIALNVMQIGTDMGKRLGPDISPNWENAWQFLKEKTPELSIVGTWWDPGHMINSLAERRNYADGAHCHNQCLYTINDRISDLGKIMVTNNETESLRLIRKYQGNSPKVYWIASSDLIGKFRWLQYFGVGCDGTGYYTSDGHIKCPLYLQSYLSNIGYANQDLLRFYQVPGTQSNIVIKNGRIPFLIDDSGKAMMFEKMIYYENKELKEVDLRVNKDDIYKEIEALKSQLNIRLLNQSYPLTLWVEGNYNYVVLIPQNLEDSVFTKMFMLEGKGLEHFKQVFRNEEVKIYEVY